MAGYDYLVSDEKQQLDSVLGAMVYPVTAPLERLAVWSLRPHFPETDSYFHHKRRGTDGAPYLIPKIRTMHDGGDAPSDVELGFHKANPRIVSGWAHFLRNTALDELPQLGLIPETLSFVGLRSCAYDFLDHMLSEVAKIDKGLSNDWEELYRYPGFRHGLTGPGQKVWLWEHGREANLLARAMQADLKYYPEKATLNGDIALIAATPFELAASAVWKRLSL